MFFAIAVSMSDTMCEVAASIPSSLAGRLWAGGERRRWLERARTARTVQDLTGAPYASLIRTSTRPLHLCHCLQFSLTTVTPAASVPWVCHASSKVALPNRMVCCCGQRACSSWTWSAPQPSGFCLQHNLLMGGCELRPMHAFLKNAPRQQECSSEAISTMPMQRAAKYRLMSAKKSVLQTFLQPQVHLHRVLPTEAHLWCDSAGQSDCDVREWAVKGGAEEVEATVRSGTHLRRCGRCVVHFLRIRACGSGSPGLRSPALATSANNHVPMPVCIARSPETLCRRTGLSLLRGVCHLSANTASSAGRP